MNAQDTPPISERPMTLSDFALYAVLVGIWGGSFIAIEFQLGVVALEVSVMWRYLMAAVVMTGVCLLARRRMRGFSLVDHLHFVALGIFFFSLNYVLIYRAQTELTSGLAAITFTMALFFTTLNARIFLGASLNPRILLGGVIGVVGLAVLFGDSLFEIGVDAGTLVGLGYMLGSAYVVSLATVVTAKLNVRRVPALQANAWGMIYGAGFQCFFRPRSRSRAHVRVDVRVYRFTRLPDVPGGRPGIHHLFRRRCPDRACTFVILHADVADGGDRHFGSDRRPAGHPRAGRWCPGNSCGKFHRHARSIRLDGFDLSPLETTRCHTRPLALHGCSSLVSLSRSEWRFWV